MKKIIYLMLCFFCVYAINAVDLEAANLSWTQDYEALKNWLSTDNADAVIGFSINRYLTELSTNTFNTDDAKQKLFWKSFLYWIYGWAYYNKQKLANALEYLENPSISNDNIFYFMSLVYKYRIYNLYDQLDQIDIKADISRKIISFSEDKIRELCKIAYNYGLGLEETYWIKIYYEYKEKNMITLPNSVKRNLMDVCPIAIEKSMDSCPIIVEKPKEYNYFPEYVKCETNSLVVRREPFGKCIRLCISAFTTKNQAMQIEAQIKRNFCYIETWIRKDTCQPDIWVIQVGCFDNYQKLLEYECVYTDFLKKINFPLY